METDKQAKDASDKAIAKQLRQFGFIPHTPAWRHLFNNASSVVECTIRADQRNDNTTALNEFLKEPIKRSVDFMTPDIAKRLSAAWEHRDVYVVMNKDMADVAKAHDFATAYELESAILSSLMRIGCRAALDALRNKKSERTP